MKLTKLINKRIVLNYTNKLDKINNQQGVITHVGQSKIAFNVGKMEIFIERKRINSVTDQHGNVYK